MTDCTPELRVVPPSDAEDATVTLDLIARARRSLAEARTLPDIRRVMEAASVAADAAQRAARLAEAQRAAAEVVDAANEAANDAAAVRIEAQAKAGELVREMQRLGGLAHRGQTKQDRMSQRATSDLTDLGVSRSESSRWQQVAAVPAEVRRDYVDQARAERQEVSTAGLLRFAEPRTALDHQAIAADARRRMRAVYRHLVDLPGLRPEALVMALDKPERRHLLQALRQLPAWIEDVIGELDVHHVHAQE